ncbi:MAG: CoA transferase [Proteobacteria bacterium]|nr:CoA transferase [Pseudomonadota bacterium]
MAGPLDGVRVIDCTSVALGPWAAMQLGDFGAEVIKVEPPGGDTTRYLGPSRNPKMGSFFMGCNRNKRSIVLDLKQSAARDALYALLKNADVLMHNLRPEPAKRLGLAYSKVALHNPEIICAAAYGYRADGPMGSNPAYDDIIQAACGLADLQTIVAGEPRYLPTMVADKTTSMALLSAILAALFEKERSGMGQEIEIPMYESMVANIMVEHLYGETLRPPSGELGYTRLINSQRRPYKTKDGYIALLPYTDRNWRDFFTAIGREELGHDERFTNIANRLSNIEDYYALIAEIAAERTNQEWLDLLAGTTVPHGRVNNLEDLLSDDQLLSTGFWRELEHPSEGAIRSPDIPQRFSRTPGSIRHLQPRLGEHSFEILKEAGFSDNDIKQLESSGATSCGDV